MISQRDHDARHAASWTYANVVPVGTMEGEKHPMLATGDDLAEHPCSGEASEKRSGQAIEGMEASSIDRGGADGRPEEREDGVKGRKVEQTAGFQNVKRSQEDGERAGDFGPFDLAPLMHSPSNLCGRGRRGSVICLWWDAIHQKGLTRPNVAPSMTDILGVNAIELDEFASTVARFQRRRSIGRGEGRRARTREG